MNNPGMPQQMYPMPQPGYAPYGINNPNQLAAMAPQFSMRQMLLSMTGAYIKQKFEFTEAFTGCETRNKYYVYEAGADGRKLGQKLLKCKEHSDFCARCCLPGSCRPFVMTCKNLHNREKISMEMQRDCQCTFLCFNRPQMKVTVDDGAGPRYIGKVVDNFDLCNHSFSVKNANHDTLYHIEADCCQLGLFCPLPCESCERIVFELWRGDRQQKLPQILLKTGHKNCLKNSMGDADRFAVPFPQGSTFEERALLIAAALLIDYRMFEEKAGGNQGGHYGGHYGY